MSDETIALLAFRNIDGSLGFAQSRDPLTYCICVERGESETKWVRGEATLEWIALARNRWQAVKVRDRLNEMEPQEAEGEMRRLALPSEVVETARALIWAHVWEDGGESADAQDQDQLSAAISAALAGGGPEEADRGGKDAGEAHECLWPQRLVIFDLDGTLADTSAFDGPGRRSHGGRLEEIRIFGGGSALGTHDLAKIVAPGRRVVVVTASPRGYAQDVLAHIGLEVDEIHARVGVDKRAAFGRAMEEAGCGPAETLVVGDRWPDWSGAARLGIPSLGGRDFGANLPEEAPDVAFRSVEHLLAVPDPARLGYVGETEHPDRDPWHSGSLLKAGPSCWALGRFFSRTARNELGLRSRLTEEILSAKSRPPSGRLEVAIKVALEQMARSDRFELSCVTSMPARPGQQDRFVTPRRWAAEILELDETLSSGSLLDLAPERGSQKGKSFSERFQAQDGRYEWCGQRLDGREVLLLDDVRTVGASVAAAARALREAGAREVHTLVWAQTQAWYEDKAEMR